MAGFGGESLSGLATLIRERVAAETGHNVDAEVRYDQTERG